MLAGVALRRRPRRTLVLCLALLLTLFAFENALHSVHHGLDDRRGRVSHRGSGGREQGHRGQQHTDEHDRPVG